MEKIDLKPCPFCGPRNVEPDLYDTEHGFWTVGCGGCGTHSGMSKNKQQVIDLWNRRPAESGKELKEISEIVEAMKGSLEISFSHYSGYHAACKNKAGDKTWNSHDLQTNSYDTEWFSSAEEAILSLLKRVKE